MSYPDLPRNRLIVDGVDLTEKFKMVLADGYTMTPPAPKTYTVDIPGGHGVLDLTESLFGDVAYENRQQEFTFYLVGVTNFEQAKSEISRFLHGRSFKYQITMDPGYTYEGRFSITKYSHGSYSNGLVGKIEVSVDANPFKYLEDRVYLLDAIGGKMFNLMSGRKRVRPTIETSTSTKIIYNSKLVTLPEGTWTLNDLMFTEGSNELYVNTYDIHLLKWGDLKTKGVTWGEFGNKRLFQWYKADGQGNLIYTVWSDYANKTWNDLAGVTWNDIRYKEIEIPDIPDVLIKYEWGDL